MKKIILIGFIVISLFVLNSCTQESNVKSPISEDEISSNEQIMKESTTKEQQEQTQAENKEEIKEYTFIQKITYKDEDSIIIITKNKITKKASIDMDILFEQSELKREFGDITEFTTTIMCGLMSMAFFNETALEEFNKELQSWNSMESTIEEDSPEEEKEEELKENPLEGYRVAEVQLSFKDKLSGKEFSECKITGASASDIIIKIY